MSDTPVPCPGWVYVLTNPHPAMRGIVKIGMTQRCPTNRANELANGTGLPTPYEVAWCAPVSDCRFVETAVHKMLDDKRVRRQREFFAVDVATARQAIEAVAGSLLRPYIQIRDVQEKRSNRARRPRPRSYLRYKRPWRSRRRPLRAFMGIAMVLCVGIALLRPQIPHGVPWVLREMIWLIEFIGFTITHLF
jgi:hypothetical protein